MRFWQAASWDIARSLEGYSHCLEIEDCCQNDQNFRPQSTNHEQKESTNMSKIFDHSLQITNAKTRTRMSRIFDHSLQITSTKQGTERAHFFDHSLHIPSTNKNTRSDFFDHSLQITSTKKAATGAEFSTTIYKSRAQRKHQNEHSFRPQTCLRSVSILLCLLWCL